jgi:hypothetical protein
VAAADGAPAAALARSERELAAAAAAAEARALRARRSVFMCLDMDAFFAAVEERDEAMEAARHARTEQDRAARGLADARSGREAADEQHDALAGQYLGQRAAPVAARRSAGPRQNERHDDGRHFHRREDGRHEAFGRAADGLHVGHRGDEGDGRNGSVVRRDRGRVHDIELSGPA